MSATDANEANELSAQLWRQRELLEMLLFKYEEDRLLKTAGLARWYAASARELDAVIDRLAQTNLATAVAISGLGSTWGLPSGALLRELADAAPSVMWREILSEHHEALVGLISEIRDVRAQSAGTYRADGSSDHTDQAARLLDAML